MAERLTVRSERGTAILKETDIKDRCEYCYEATQKLAHYEDLEEQGRLVILQKPIGRVTFDQFNREGGTHDTSTND